MKIITVWRSQSPSLEQNNVRTLIEELPNHHRNETSFNTSIISSSPQFARRLSDNSSLASEDALCPPLNFQSPNHFNEESRSVNDMGSRLSCASVQSSYHTSSDACSSSDTDLYSDQTQFVHTNIRNGTITNLEYKLPIVGYEVMEERTRFTVFKIQVEHKISGSSWFVFRRYTDFVRLHRKLKETFPSVHFILPPKKWLGDNFSPGFLEERLHGLQKFVQDILTYKDISNSKPVRAFFCLDEPPGPHDTIEESRAQCENLEDELCRLQHQLKDKDSEITQLREEVNMLRSQQETLLNSLRLECTLTAYTQSRNPKSWNCSEKVSPHKFGETRIPSNIQQCAIELQNLSKSLAQMNCKPCQVPNDDSSNVTCIK